MEFIRLYLTRILAHWSCDESHLLHFMNEIVAHHLSPPDSLEDYSTTLPNDRGPRLASSFFSSSFKPTELLPLILDELCGRPDMIGFIKYVSEAVGPNGRSLLSGNRGSGSESGVIDSPSLLCNLIVEPICQRLDTVSSFGKLPMALRCILSSMVSQTREDEQKRSQLFFVFANSLVPRITRWLTTSKSNDEEDCGVSIGEQAQVLDTIQELMRICFTRGVWNQGDPHCSSPGSNSPHRPRGGGSLGTQFSLQIHATLSRSRWLISRSFP